MPNTLGKNLHLCFSIIKSPQHEEITPYTIHNNNNPLHHHPLNNTNPSHLPPTTFSTFFKNYNSLYEEDSAAVAAPATTSAAYYTAPASPTSDTADMMDVDDDDATVAPNTPDLTAIYTSRRFFISSPGQSNSIVDSLTLSLPSSDSPEEDPTVVAGGVAVQTYSPDPYADFRKSMQEMVEARDLHGSIEAKEEAWDYLQELLLSYLSLNPKSTHKYIVWAFADLVVTLMSHNKPSTSSSSFSSSFCSSSGVAGDHAENSMVGMHDSINNVN